MSLKSAARKRVAVEEDEGGAVHEMSITVGYLGGDVRAEEMDCLHKLLREKCVSGLVAMERGEMENHLHFQMVVRAICPSARSFGVTVRKYMGWHGKKNMNPVGKVTCKILTQRGLHTFKGMLGYCVKDAGRENFVTATFNITEADIETGVSLHRLYGRADLKSKVTLTPKNLLERMYVWYRYKVNRPLTMTFLTLLTEMINSGGFVPAASWIVPMAGQGMDYRRMSLIWKCLLTPANVRRNEVREIFMQRRHYVNGRYHDTLQEFEDMAEGFLNDLPSPPSPAPSPSVSVPAVTVFPASVCVSQVTMDSVSQAADTAHRLSTKMGTNSVIVSSERHSDMAPAYISLLKQVSMIHTDYIDVLDPLLDGGETSAAGALRHRIVSVENDLARDFWDTVVVSSDAEEGDTQEGDAEEGGAGSEVVVISSEDGENRMQDVVGVGQTVRVVENTGVGEIQAAHIGYTDVELESFVSNAAITGSK